ncbi:leucine-rich repeat domain-containing protein [Natranaerofaba carboxydovora]|uniref:leucine-rich repeat domain-containing protein n=1 Tax=Natranaerofaba carboxydovora TaxID=2742683 RepID=UPI001F12F4DD|nr:leucine-rich repeat domain-containing protein [Natranaerofaba carboxydovora]UMZ73003.1 Internalin-A [Natranaerofaba carboxydovora]
MKCSFEEVLIRHLGDGKSLSEVNDGNVFMITNETVAVLNQYITNLKGIEKFHKVKTLNFSENKIEDINWFYMMPDPDFIEEVILSSNYIENISPIKTFTNIDELNLSNNKLVDITPLKNLNNLKLLNLSYNSISDISLLSDLESLRNLSLKSNQISDISPLKELKGLFRIDLRDNPVNKQDILDLEVELGTDINY